MNINDADLNKIVALKECPFCGGQNPVIGQIGNNYTPKRFVYIKCKKCKVKMKVGAIRGSIERCEEVVTKQWNNRIFKKEG